MMTSHEQARANRARLDAWYHALLRRPGYDYCKLMARRQRGEAVLRQWRELWARLDAQRALRRMLRGGAV